MSALRRVRALGRGTTGRFAVAVLAGAGAAGATVGLLATAAWLISRAAEHPPVAYLMVAIVAVRAFAVGRGVLRYAERLTGHDAALRVLARLRVTVYERLERLAPAGLARLRAGDLASRLVDDVDGLADLWLRVLLPYAVAALAGAGTVALVAAALPGAAAALAVSLLAVAALAPALAARYARRAEARIAPARGALSAATLDLLRGAAELTAYDAVDAALARADAADARLRAAERRSAGGLGVGAAVAAVAAGLAVWAALGLGVPAVHAHRLAPVLLAVVVLTPLAVHEVFAALPAAAGQLPRVRGAAVRVLDVLDTPDPVREPDEPAAPPTGPLDLRVQRLSARWSAAGPPVLADLDLAVPAGTALLVTGPSGAGKSTLAAVLLRFLEPTAGRVLLGGVDTATMAGDEVRALVGLCAQDAHVFDTTIAENVRLARPDATDAQLRAALAAARLGDWVAGLPAGLDTFVGEHGARLSGGQRQRLALARVLLADFPVVVFDEPTEHLDEPTAAALTTDLLAATAGRTVLLVTHRPELAPAGLPRLRLPAAAAVSGAPPATSA